MFEKVLESVEKKLSVETGEKVKIYSSGTLGGGCINHASKLETNIGNLFLKWNACCDTDMFIREAEGLKELAKAADRYLKVPEVLCSEYVTDNPGFLVLEYIQPGYGRENDDEMLGRGLAKVHQFASDKFGFYSNNYCGATPQNNKYSDSWAKFFCEQRLRYLLDLIQKHRPMPGHLFKDFEKLLDKIPNLVPKTSIPVLIHGDLWSGNYMNTGQGPALIDPAAYYADREMEFAIITMFGGFSSRFYSAYNEVSPLEPDWRRRNELYQLYHVLNHYYLFGGGYLQQALSIISRFV